MKLRREEVSEVWSSWKSVGPSSCDAARELVRKAVSCGSRIVKCLGLSVLFVGVLPTL